jgi:quercetin 2,3-dioxygenase
VVLERFGRFKKKKVSAVHRAGAVLEPGNWNDYYPFLLLMEDNFEKGAFDIHPHSGMETITYVIDGTINHYDSVTGEGGRRNSGDQNKQPQAPAFMYGERLFFILYH